VRNNDQLMRQRFGAQLLTQRPDPRVDSAVDVVRHLLAVQAQDPRGMRLSIRPRCPGSTRSDVDAALNDGSLVVGWLNRGTLHLVRAADYWWLHALTTPQLRTSNSRRLNQEGVNGSDAKRAVGIIENQLKHQGVLTRSQIRELLKAAGITTEGQALVHILLRACIDGIAVRGPMVADHHAYVYAEEWLGARPEVELDQAVAELAVRYLRGHGPADAPDLAKWAGITLTAARRGFSQGVGISQREDGLFILADAPAEVSKVPAPTLLGPFDPLLLGWRSRDSIVDVHRGIITTNGLFRAFALVAGRAVATWRWVGGNVVLEPLEPISKRDLKMLDEEASDVVRFLT